MRGSLTPSSRALAQRGERGLVALMGCALALGWRAAARQRRQLEATKWRLQAVLDALQEGVVLVGRDQVIEACNPSARRLTGVRLLGASAPLVALRADGSEMPACERPSHVAAQTGEAVSGVEMGVLRPDGSVAWLRVYANPLPDGPDDPGPYPVVVSFADVSAQRASLEALQRSNAELRQFAYVASHDLSEPLRMVTSYLQLLRRRYGDGRLGADADEFIAHAVDGSVRMRALIEDLLSYSRAGRSSEPGRVDTGELLASVLTDLGAAVADASAVLDIGELPAVTGDARELRQVFQNLVANALKFRRGPGVLVSVRAERCAPGWWAFTVADDGIGIPLDQSDRVFEMFQRLHPRDDYEGTGIGLAICRKIVEHHGGTIGVAPRPGGGTEFRFELPAADSGGAGGTGRSGRAAAALS
jgi:signal transduction histidine kinase